MAGLGEMFGASLATVNGKKPRNSDRIQPGQPLNLRGAFEAAQNIPVAGDVLSGVMASYDAAKGDYPSAAMNAVGILPFVSGAVFHSAKTHIAQLFERAAKGEKGQREVIGIPSIDQKSALLEHGYNVENLTARNMKHLEEKVSKSFPEEEKGRFFDVITDGAADSSLLKSAPSGTPPTFTLINDVSRIDSDGNPYRNEAVFKILGKDADLYSAGRRYENPKEWAKFEKRYRR